MRKGITPIIATVVLLLVVIAIAGAAYTYITGFWGSLTSRVVQLQSVTCTSAGVIINLRNVGNANVTITDGSDVSYAKSVIAGNASASTSFLYTPTGGVLSPGASGSVMDQFCSSSVSGTKPTCRYTINAGGTSFEAQVTC